MGEIATSDREVVLFYNPQSVLSKKVIAYAEAEGFALREVDIQKNRFTGTQLEELADRLHITINGLVNKAHPDFKKYFGNPDLSDRDWIKLLRKNPELLIEPIIIRGDKTRRVKTPSEIVNF